MGVLSLFLGSIIYNKRREMNLTQIELANDICTQNTISKIEKHNIAPTVNILIKICLKLNLTLNDVFSDFSSKNSADEESILDAIERDALLRKTDDIDSRLSLLQGKLSNNDMEQYELITGVMHYWASKFDASLFILDKVLQLSKSAKNDVYTLLAYLFKGLNYLGQDHVDRAQYYFQMIENSVDENSKIANSNELEILFICKTLAESYNEMKLPKKATEFSVGALEYARKKHVAYFLDELNYQAALAISDDVDKDEEYKNFYNLAYYLAKADGNDKLLKIMEAK